MKTNVYLHIAIRIIIMGALGMLFTYIPDQLRDFFGDVLHKHTTDCNPYCRIGSGIDSPWTWGIRHYWYYWTVFLLFILSIINVIISIVNKINRNYPSAGF